MSLKNDKEVSKVLKRLGPYLTHRRQRENLTLREFGHRTGISHSTLFQLEQFPNKNPTLSTVLKIARAFNESIGEFLKPILESKQKPVADEVEIQEEPIPEASQPQ